MTDKMWESYTEEELQMETLTPFHLPFCSDLLAKVAWLMKHLPEPPCGVLDVGNGVGWLTAWLSIAGYRIDGVEPSKIAKKTAVKTLGVYGRDKYAICCYDTILDYLRLCEKESCDVVIYQATLHHIYEWKVDLGLSYQSLRSKGKLFLIEPGWRHAHNSKEFVKEHPGVIEQSMPPYKTVPVLRKIGFKNIKVYPNYAFMHKLCKKGVPSILAAIAVHLYKWFDGLIIAEK